MKSKKYYNILFIMFLSLIAGYPSYGSEQGGSLPQAGQVKSDPDMIEQALVEQKKRGDVDIEKRTNKRLEARELQKTGKSIKKDVKTTMKPIKGAGSVVGSIASASGDPHARMAAITFNIAIASVEKLGEGIAGIVIGVGRYQERSQQILSVVEVLIENARKSEEKILNLTKSLKALLDIDKLPEPTQSTSVLKQLRKNASNKMITAGNKVRQATDVLTNEKAARAEKIKAIQADLKEENENYAETIRVLQIKLLQDAVNEISKKINIDKTIENLESDLKAFQNAKKDISKNKSKQKKQTAEIKEAEARTNKDLVYYLKFQASPTKLLEKLKEDRSILQNKVTELTKLTKLGGVSYLQKRTGHTDTQLNTETIVALYREIDAILDALCKIDATKGGLGDLCKKIQP